jgi:hypothetical protein
MSRDETLRLFASRAVHFWAHHIPAKVKCVTTYWGDWQVKHGPYTAMYQTAEEKAARCVRRYVRRPGFPPIGMCCHKCRGVLVAINESQRSPREIWNTAAHEVIHLAHPSWDEEQVEAVTRAVCQLWPWHTKWPAVWKEQLRRAAR